MVSRRGARHAETRTRFIHILGASGSGTTTLGQNIAGAIDAESIDVDDFFWAPTDPPYTTPRTPLERVQLLTQAVSRARRWVLSGCLCGWGDSLARQCDLAVFLTAPTVVRLERLRSRQHLRFGARIAHGGDMHQAHEAFLAWAARYDTGGVEQRSRELHEAWLAGLSCPVLRLDGTAAPTELVRAILDHDMRPG
ncbi:MAG: hypothetical protein IPI67_13025 [Myxococcales bacterium]|nr:hypothetical protein [Myxococcales bacterium]